MADNSLSAACGKCLKPKFDPTTSTIASSMVGEMQNYYCMCGDIFNGSTAPHPFMITRSCSYQEHCERIKTMIAEGLHDGERWKPESHARYTELESAAHAGRVTFRAGRGCCTNP